MSQEAYNNYTSAAARQRYRNEARRIRMRVDQARKSQHAARFRWPFELLQNALDSGPRHERQEVTIRLHREHSQVVFEHDGAPFRYHELAALISGGSSKEFESQATTGRFGTGFLVTHVLAQKARLRGLLQVDTGSCELFQIELDRSGDEAAILSNIRRSEDAILGAEEARDDSDIPSVTIKYESNDDSTWDSGLHELRRALPYLYGTRRELGSVELQVDADIFERWRPSTQESIDANGCIESRTVDVSQDNKRTRTYVVYRFARAPNSSAAALVLVERTDAGLRVCLPESTAPRVFREYPIRSSGFIPMNFVLDGKFETEQERSALLMSDADRTLLREALTAALTAVEYAVGQGWKDAHLLAVASRPKSGFDTTNTEENEWWTNLLSEFARNVAAMPIVDCGSRFLPAISSDHPFADFIVPRLRLPPGSEETSVKRLWPLVHAVDALLPPRKELASEWTLIAEGWSSLGLELGMVSVEKLADWVRTDDRKLEQLKIDGDRYEWLARYVDIVGECTSKRNTSDFSAVDGLLPNQSGQLCNVTQLNRDGGVSDALKDICSGMAYEVRDKLLFDGFDTIGERLGLQYLGRALTEAIPKEVAEAAIISDAIEWMDAKLPESQGWEDARNVYYASIQLLDHLRHCCSEPDVASTARRIPLVASNGHAVRWRRDHLYMAPACTWPRSAQPFANAYPRNRVLDYRYAGSASQAIPNVIPALAEWGIALVDPLISDTVDLRDRRLAALSADDTKGVVVPQQQLSQIALLQPEVLNRCQEADDRAKALLGLVLCHVARSDQTWKRLRTVKGMRQNQEIDLSIRGALWLADLKVRAWVPVPSEDGNPQKMVASSATLKNLIDVEWLHDNDDAIQLLSDYFGFDQLELRLLGITQDDQERHQVRMSLSRLLEVGGADFQLYARLAEQVDAERQRRSDVERFRNLGLAVQDAIGTALKRHNLQVDLVDRGFDFEVSFDEGMLEDAGTLLELGPYLVEVKATQTGRARLTPLQAETAANSPDRYVLCVVDLSCDFISDQYEDMTADRVERLAKLVPDIGAKVQPTYKNVEAAKTSTGVSIQNDSALRYEVPRNIWEESGIPIAAWVEAIKSSLQ